MLKNIYTVREVAESGIIGYKYSSILKFCKSGQLGHIRIGSAINSKILIRKKDIELFIKNIK